MGGVRGIVLDSSVLLPSADDEVIGDAGLCSGAEFLLRKLRYSSIPIGISHEQGLSSSKECLLKEVAKTYLCTIFCLLPQDDISSEVSRIWEGKDGRLIHVVSWCREDLSQKKNGSHVLKVIVGSAEREASSNSGYAVTAEMLSISINKLQELPLLVCSMNIKAAGEEAMAVGYVMKPSREEDFAKRGSFPLCPTQNGLIFLPLNYDLPISSQLQLVDAILHKATDEILAVDMTSPSELSDKVTFTRNLQELQRYVECQTDCCIIDPFNNIFPILDRMKIQQILMGLETLNTDGRCRIRAPSFFKVDSFDDPNLEQRLAEAKLRLPSIVKPQVACGVSDAHSMAIVFKVDHYKDLNVPLPAVVQEYVDHSSLIYKFYALGGKVFHAVKKSIPNSDTLMNLAAEKGLKPLHFDSLKSLPVSKEQLNVDNHKLDLELVKDAADWLRRALDLTIFGFDVVIQEGSGDHVIVDVNYLPSFKEVPDDTAIPAFWDALKEKIVSRKNQKEETS
ncbi:inositol-1,3,4-trisphosphate 5/6-kinase [Salvia divinorum]|uniref:inositol-1,3,4-trisphosphate 5/6-kinase n=1 Tax=Salvia divinorum TaxID=28513 RepID=A0ABD1GEE3_SALDI